MTAHNQPYVGRHRKPELPTGSAITDAIRATFELFTHPPMHNNPKEKN